MTFPRRRPYFWWTHCINCRRFHLRGRYTLCRACEAAISKEANAS